MARTPTRSAIAIALVALCCTSCGGGKRFYPVRGRVTVDGKPAGGMSVVFFLEDDPDAKPLQPSAIVQPDGTFEVKTFVVQDRQLKDGAPAGKYRVSCVWYPPDLQKYVSAMAPLPDRLNGRYSDPKTSGLRAEVPEQAVDLPAFELSTHAGK